MQSKDIGNIVRQARKNQHLTQQALAAAADVSTRFVHDLERGKATVELGLTLRVLASLGIEVSLLAAEVVEGREQ
ncbi:type II toxin-antitoxin system Y4mF family antitoxin [Alcanivorax quisquiliarum]|uniref:Type II toxin-antitoxin system Y4mF family antitoxin n=1 Tax=Alcanivorax quisquiliarum TaxID=2933565 RepID=A0ABT0E7E0_9GAMM|nr:type II toxin-antitoxin system Y4mF family antitoxin [Alcanivorax quisquiliarum]